MMYKFRLTNDLHETLDSIEFEYDPTNFSSPLQQAADGLIPQDDWDAYYHGENDAYQNRFGQMRYIEEQED